MSDMPPDWAIERALTPMRERHVSAHWTPELIKSDADQSTAGFKATVRELARYIAAHEEPPVDPLLVMAREICAMVLIKNGYSSHGGYYRKGIHDEGPSVQFVLSKLRELAK